MTQVRARSDRDDNRGSIMAGPTTESINDDVKVLRDDLHRLEVSVNAGTHKVELDVARLAAEFNLAKWLIGLTLVATLTGIGGGIWWAGRIDAKVSSIEASLMKILDQTRNPK